MVVFTCEQRFLLQSVLEVSSQVLADSVNHAGFVVMLHHVAEPSEWIFKACCVTMTTCHGAKHHCQAPFSSKAGLKFGPEEIHTFSWEPWLLCWELHLLNLEGLHFVLVADLCFVLGKIFSASAGVKLLC